MRNPVSDKKRKKHSYSTYYRRVIGGSIKTPNEDIRLRISLRYRDNRHPSETKYPIGFRVVRNK